MSARARSQREELRFRAADMFAGGIGAPRVAQLLGITRKSACEWRRAWLEGGKAALVSKGPSSRCQLSDEQLERLQEELKRGAAAYGWADQRWTLSRVRLLIEELFGVSYTVRGVGYLLTRLEYSPQVPAHQALERDEEKIARWQKRGWANIKVSRRPGAPGSSSSTSPGGA
ncbi:transposase [Streptosporangium amethystogenes]|uniref:transposase n=1 Tax=Streptosporangium amethystogenes TaxID=2002 RepID=UPI0037AC5183